MAGKSAALTTSFVELVFQALPITGIADNTATSPLTNLYVGLYLADPSGGDQTTSEMAYTGYARVAVARTTGGWVVTGLNVNPAAIVTFGLMTAGVGGSASFWGIGTASSGTGELLYTAAISPALVVVNGVTPILGSGASRIAPINF